MFSQEEHDFIDMLFGKLTCLTDTEMIDLQDDDSCCDHLEFENLLSPNHEVHFSTRDAHW